MGNSSRKTNVVIAVDVMGGDNAPYSAVAGVCHVLKTFPQIKFQLFGDKNKIELILASFKGIDQSNIEIFDTDKYILSDEKPSNALRNSKGSSMRLAIEQVKLGKADAVVSSGNTGALMAIAKVVLRTLTSISRPAIAAIMPTATGSGKMVLLDAGANTECNSEVLFQFAVMGDAFARASFNNNNPSIGLLNIGTEDVKGNETIKTAWALLKKEIGLLNFYGYVEGDDILSGKVDVVVTDGFTGNVALKTIEGTVKLTKHFFKNALKSSFLARIGAYLAAPALKKSLKVIDHKEYNGALLVGLNGIVIKSHGSADDIAFASALKRAISLVENEINNKIISVMDKHTKHLE